MSAPAGFWETVDRAPALAADAVIALFPAAAAPWVRHLVVAAALIAVFGSLFALLTLAERKGLGRIQNRPGPNRVGPGGLLQPLADAIKMLGKEDIVPLRADRALHFLAPVLLVAASLLTLAVIPYGRHLLPVDLEAGVLWFFAAAAISELAVFCAGWSSRNKYALLAAMRALAQMLAYELPLVLAVVPAVMLSGSLSPREIVAAQSGWIGLGLVPLWHVLTPWGLGGFLVFLVAAFAESNRSPFDLPEAESELIAGHLTEYSGFKYALFFMAEYFGMIALSALAVTLFLGGWHAPFAFLAPLPSWGWFFLKLAALVGVFIWVRGTVPRLRMDQLMRLAWKLLVPLALLNLVNAAFWHASAAWPAAAQPVRWLLSFALLAGPFVLLGRSLGRGLGPRTYRYAP